MRILAVILLIMLAGNLMAQQGVLMRNKSNPHYQQYRLEGGIRARQSLEPEKSFTSVAFTLPSADDFNELYCIVAGDTFALEPAPHQPEVKKGFISNLIVLPKPQLQLQLLGEVPSEKGIIIHFFYAEPLPEKPGGRNLRKAVNPCEAPEVVPQSVWRKGLPEPDYTRSFTEVEHLIVHHSAAGNNAADYTEEVRNYYLYHTQANGWSDIGYNYLIAPDGTLYAGRDPGNGEQDNVTGAHFCGKNSNTMGVCMIGDYTNREPTAAAMLQLEHLLSWKCLKEKLNPLAATPHPANSDLGVIAGHRDGCSTLCPGEEVYQRLPELRLAVSANLESCNEIPAEEEVWVYFASRQQEVCLAGVDEDEIKSFAVYNVQGKNVTGTLEKLKSENFCVQLEDLAPGVYLLQVEYGQDLIKKKILLF